MFLDWKTIQLKKVPTWTRKVKKGSGRLWTQLDAVHSRGHINFGYSRNSFPNNCSCLEESTTFSQESNFARNEICRSHRQKEVGSVRKEKSCENISACEKRMNTEANYFIRRKQYLSLEFPK